MYKNLIQVTNQAKNLLLDIKYATTDNFTGRRLYKKPLAYLHKDVLPDFVAACEEFERLGFGVKVWDAYRPFSVTQKMWDITPESKKQYVADPAKGSVHNRGCAIDMTLYDIKTGKDLKMPTSFDDFSKRAHANADITDKNAAKNRDLLIKVMQNNHFIVEPNEWWHFNWQTYQEYSVLNDAF